ncbi:MAG: DUF4082 domain-containing protein, partial [Actinomycetota bacterium]|nr:DUF4082 domain-containing protein [Actinomycetota bacterium]
MIHRRARLALALCVAVCVLVARPADAATPQYPDLKTVDPSELHSEVGTVNGEPRWLLRFSNWVWNAGQGALEVRGTPGGGSTVYQRVYDDAGGFEDRTVATDLIYHPTHNHFHLDRFAQYELWTKAEFDEWVASGRSFGRAKHHGTKASFCLVDSGRLQALPGSPSSGVYRLCDQEAQGISVGYGDFYSWSLPEQWVDVGASPLANGTYVLRSVVDPDNKLYESASRSDSTRESGQSNEGIAQFTVSAPVISGVSATASQSGEATVSWTTDVASSSRVDYGTDPAALGQSVSDATRVTAHSVRLAGLVPGATYHFRVSSVDAAGDGAMSPLPPQAPATFTVPGTPGCPCSLWSGTTVPGTPAQTNDGNAVEVGVKVTPAIDGTITALRFYKGSTNTGTPVGNLWTAQGLKLASVTFTDETASGWQQAKLSTPVAVKAGTTYVASYHAPNGNFAMDQGYFSTAFVSGPLTAPSSDESGGNGVYGYGASAFPTSTYNASNYWVDVVLETGSTSGTDTTAPTVTSVSPSDGATGVAVSVAPTATFSEPIDASTISTSTVRLSGPSGTVAATVFYDSATQRATLAPETELAAATTYTMTVQGGTGGVADLAGNRLANDRSWSFTTEAEPAPDTVAPVISAVSATASESGEATVSWTTDEPSDSRVDYGTDPGTLDRNAGDATPVTAHSVRLGGLTPGARYHYRVTSVDAAANSATSPATSEPPASFTVPVPPPVASPGAVVVETGGVKSGTAQSLAAEDTAYL